MFSLILSAKTTMYRDLGRLLCCLLGLTGLTSPIVGFSDEPPTIQVYKLASCGCCRPWIKYMESEGFRVQATDVIDVQPFKREQGVPQEYAACHTGTVDGYVLEGHVTAEEVRRLLKERPPIKGLLVPGMPKGAPGMEGPDAVAYDVLALHADGTVSTYASHTPPAAAETAPPAAAPAVEVPAELSSEP